MLNDNDRKIFLESLVSESPAYGVVLNDEVIIGLWNYYKLLDHWNDRLHLVAPCSAEEFATRHILESLYMLKHIPTGAKAIDVGSGGGLPMVPSLIARSDINATLIESSKRKSVFLHEVVKHAGISRRTAVITDRFENVSGVKGEIVTCRALDRFEDRLKQLIDLASQPSTLILFGGNTLREKLKDLGIELLSDELLPNSEKRFLFVVRR